MNTEFNNNSPDELEGLKEYLADSNQEPIVEQSQDNNQNHNYPNEETKKTKKMKKMKKKRKGFGAFKLTASAMAFGLIAGVVFQGYNYVMVLTGNEPNSSNGFKVAEVKETSSSKDAIIPTNTSTENSVVTDVSGVVDSVMPSIVAINSSATETSYDLFGREVEQPVQGSGSGIIIGQNNSELLIVTNNHVINGATSVQIVFADKKKASATIKGADANADLAVLSVNMKDLSDSTLKAIKVAVLGKSEQVKAGDMAIAIGNALGYGQSVTVGYISAVNREVTIDNKTMTLLQTDAAINPGNSGGALLNTQGQVIGINSVKYASEDVEGMGYAIPISSAIPMINELMNRQTVTQSEQGFLGLDASTAQNVTDEYANRFNMPIGIYVNNVVKNSPAQKAGLKQGDIITGLDNETIKTIEDLANALNYKKAGQTVDLKIKTKTNGEYKDKVLKITLAKKN